MSSGKDNVIFLGKTRECIVYERVLEAVHDTGQGMTVAQLVGVLEAVKINLFNRAAEEAGDD